MSADFSKKSFVGKKPFRLFRPISLEEGGPRSSENGAECAPQCSQRLIRPVPYTPKAGERLFHLDTPLTNSLVTEMEFRDTLREHELEPGILEPHPVSSDAQHIASIFDSNEVSPRTRPASSSQPLGLRQEDAPISPIYYHDVGSGGVGHEQARLRIFAPNPTASRSTLQRSISQDPVNAMTSVQLPVGARRNSARESSSPGVFGRVSSCVTITSIQTNNSIASAQASEFAHSSPRKSEQSLAFTADEKCGTMAPEICERGKAPSPDWFEKGISPRFLSSRRLSDPSHKSSFREMKEEFNRRTQNRLREFVASSREKVSFEARAKGRMSTGMVLTPTDKDDGRLDLLLRKTSLKRTSRAAPLVQLRAKLNLSQELHEDTSNPWFQERTLDLDDEKDVMVDRRSYVSSQSGSMGSDQGSKPEKSKKIRFKKLGRIFWKDDAARVGLDGIETASSSSSGSPCITPSSTDEALLSQKDGTRNQSMNLEYLQEDIKRAILKRESLSDVLGLLVFLPDRPNEELSEILFKYLATSTALESGIKLLVDDSDPRISGVTSRSNYKPFREMLAYYYVTGPRRLKKAILQHHKARGELFTFLGSMHTESPSSEKFAFKIHNLVAILNGVLREFPADFTEYLSGKKGFLYSLVRNYIHIPEVVDLICQLCAADALTDNEGDEFRYGARNASGIVLLAKEGIPNALVYIFGEASYPDGHVIDEKLRWQLQVLSLKCLLELSKRAVITLKCSKTNCSYSSKFIRTVNTSLDMLSPYENIERVSSVVDAGLGAVRQLDDKSGFKDVIQCNNAAVCAMSFATELLDMIRNAEDCKSVVTRRTVGSIDTRRLEEVLVQRTRDFCDLLDAERVRVVRGRLRTTLVRTFCSLFGSRNEGTERTLIECGVARCLLDVIRVHPMCSILHGCMVECIATSVIRESRVQLFQSWMEGLQRSGMLAEMAEVIERKGSDEGDGEVERSTYESTLVEIGLVIFKFSQNLTRGRFRGMFESQETYEMFIGKIEKGLGLVQERRRGCCGGPKPERAMVSVLANADALVARLNDFEAV